MKGYPALADDLLSKHHSDTQHVLHAEVEHPKINNSIIIKLSSLLCICYSIPLLVVDAQELMRCS